MEDGLPSDPTEQLPDTFLNLLLAFNLHHTSKNIISRSFSLQTFWLVINISNKLMLIHCHGLIGKGTQHRFLHFYFGPSSAELQNSFEELLLFGYKYLFVLHVCVLFCHPAPSDNVIMQELKKKNVKILSEKVLLLLNRGGKTQFFVILHIFLIHFHNAIIIIHLLFVRWSCVCVQTHPACTTLSAQVSAGRFRQQRNGWHLLPQWHDGDDWHCSPANIWPFTWRQGERLTCCTAVVLRF